MKIVLALALLSLGAVSAHAQTQPVQGFTQCNMTTASHVTVWAPKDYVDAMILETWTKEIVHVSWTYRGLDNGGLIEIDCLNDNINVRVRGFGKAILRIVVLDGTVIEFPYE